MEFRIGKLSISFCTMKFFDFNYVKCNVGYATFRNLQIGHVVICIDTYN